MKRNGEPAPAMLPSREGRLVDTEVGKEEKKGRNVAPRAGETKKEKARRQWT